MSTNARSSETRSSETLSLYREWVASPITDPPVYSVVIPAYNESERVVFTIGAIATHVSGLGQPWELIVSDDGSTDGTVGLVEDLGLPNLRVVSDGINRGKGAAVRQGMLAARGDYILFADADQSTPITQFELLLEPLLHGAAVSIGSRAADGATVANKSGLRTALTKGLNLLVRSAIGLPYLDTQCGFKMFTRSAVHDLFGRQLIDRFSFDLEVLFLADRLGLDVAEIPVEWIDAPGSTVSPAKVALEFLRDIAQIRVWAAQGRYDTIHNKTRSGSEERKTLADHNYSSSA